MYYHEVLVFGSMNLVHDNPLEYYVYILLCSYDIVAPADNLYGSQEKNGTWNGMVGMVMRKVRSHITYIQEE